MNPASELTLNRPLWIISRHQDLLWFHGSVVAGLILLGIFLNLAPLNSTNYTATHPAVILLLLWGIFFDGTHVWGTYARTYFAAHDTHSRLGLPSHLAWGFLLIGPGLAIVDYLWFTPEPSLVGQAGVLFRHFLVFAYLWAFWHLIRQHYGILVLYRRKAGETTGQLDTVFLWLGSLYPYLRFSLSEAYLQSHLPHPLPVAWFETTRFLLDITFFLSMMGLASYALYQYHHQPFHFKPKHGFLAIVVSFHWLVFSLLDNLLVITAVLTIFHNLQYHRIVWQYERGCGRIPMGSVFRYLGWGILFGLFWYGPRTLGVAATTNDLIRNILLGFGWGIAFHHYYTDSRIWKVRRYPSVAQSLDAGAVPNHTS